MPAGRDAPLGSPSGWTNSTPPTSRPFLALPTSSTEWSSGTTSRDPHDEDRAAHHLPVASGAELPAVLHGTVDLPGRHVAHLDRARAARAAPDGQRHRDRAADRRPVRPDPHPRRVGGAGRRPFEQAHAAAGHAVPRDGAVVRAGGARVLAGCAPVVLLRGGVRRRDHDGLRQPDASGVRLGDGARGQRPERGEPERRADDELAHHRAGAGGPAVRHGRVRMVLHRRRSLLPRRARQPAG